jgi:riboflavin biosynthesis pyrimidine reductase
MLPPRSQPAWWDAGVRQLLPTPADQPADSLSDDDLLAAYAVPADADRHLRMNFVASADGAATIAGRSGGLSTPPDKRVFALLRDLADVVLVGAGTVREEGYGYPEFAPERRERRRTLGLADVPTFAVVSGSLDLDPASSLFVGTPVRTLVLTTDRTPADRRAALAEVADVLTVGTAQVSLAAAVDALVARGLRRILCEGGPRIFGGLVEAGRVDELCLTICPLLAGPGPGRIVAGPGWPPVRVSLVHALEEDGTLFLRYRLGRD